MFNIAVSMVCLCIVISIDYSLVLKASGLIYWLGIFLLALNKVIPKQVVNGAGSWLTIGGVNIVQPSEFVKIGLILLLAKKINDMEGKINNIKNLSIIIFYSLIPMGFIASEPDLGMTMIYFFIVFGILFLSGLNYKIILGGTAVLIMSITVLWYSPLIHPYQKARVTAFLNTDNSSAADTNEDYQVNQSIIAIGNGGLKGNGFLKGPLIQGAQVPFCSTDFIFSVVGEEWGFLFQVSLLALYGGIIYRILRICKNSKDIAGSVICSGVAFSLLFSVTQNVAMTIKMLPITGITLPFMSYGGSSLMSNFILIGFILNVGMRNKKIVF
jgi:rod shape determining protein RodA